MMKSLLFSAILLGWATGVSAQSSTVCNADGTVTFNYKNDSAKTVMVDVQFAGRNAMTRSADGTWTVTLGPVAPDMYPYCFIVDGVSVMDPENPNYFPNEGFKNSLLEIPGGGSLPHDIRDVPHGRLEYVHYYSKSLGATNNAIVYLPPRYMVDQQKKYPVFYLISGTTDTEEVYYKVGRVNYILDNLIADKQAKEMIVVLPYGNPSKLKIDKESTTSPAPTAQMNFGGDVFSKDLINDLMPYIEQNYRTANNRDHRAIGGFSRGGNQALFNGLTNLDKFSYLCSYSSFTSTDIPNVYDNAAETNKKLHLFWLGVGTDDFLYGTARDYMQFLDDKGIRSVKELTHDKYGHTWMNAKYFLSKTLPLLFNKKAAEEAMQNGKPAPAATGKEQQFTPGVMARLFPRPIISPEYDNLGITFRFKAPDAKKVELECDILPENVALKCDSDGVWSTTLTDYLFETFRYCFVVDGTRVADPNNMYLSPDQGFKYSVADNPRSPFNFASQGDIQHGRTGYDVDRQEAWYISPMPSRGMALPRIIQLIPGEGDTMESWFKVGGADAIADRLYADGKTKPCILTTSSLDFMQQSGMPQMPGFSPKVLRADDYPTWTQRRRALVKLLIDLGKEEAPSFPGGGFPGGGFGGRPGGFQGGGPGGGFGGGAPFGD
jgi:enterochelin esterase-like enzyme